jgi:hypothetical protein
MKPYLINLINAVVLIAMGSWGYWGSGTPSITALIPVFLGIVLLIVTPQFRKGNRVIAHIAVILTLFIFIALYKPLTGAIGRNDPMATGRVVIMMASCLLALIIFIKSFVDARVKKKS